MKGYEGGNMGEREAHLPPFPLIISFMVKYL
jgi:hypothetical protein